MCLYLQQMLTERFFLGQFLVNNQTLCFKRKVKTYDLGLGDFRRRGRIGIAAVEVLQAQEFRRALAHQRAVLTQQVAQRACLLSAL